MKNYIQNELMCLRAAEPVGSDRYEELSKAIQWVEEHAGKNQNDIKVNKTKYAHTTIKWKDDGKEELVAIKIGYKADENTDDSILFCCEDMNEFERLKEYDNGLSFVIVGCTTFTETI